MNKILLISLILLGGCSPRDQTQRYQEEAKTFIKICIDGVSYYRGYSFLSPVFTKESVVEKCGK